MGDGTWYGDMYERLAERDPDELRRYREAVWRSRGVDVEQLDLNCYAVSVEEFERALVDIPEAKALHVTLTHAAKRRVLNLSPAQIEAIGRLVQGIHGRSLERTREAYRERLERSTPTIIDF